MRPVTVGAANLPEAYRVRRRFGKLHSLLLVAGITNVGLGPYGQHGVPGRMHPVTIYAGNIAALVFTALPADMFLAVMAIDTHAVLLIYRCIRVGAEAQYRWTILARANLASMSTFFDQFLYGFRAGDTWPVAGLALQAGKWRALVALLAMFGFENVEYRVFVVFVVAFDTGIGAFFAVGPGLSGRLDVSVAGRCFIIGGLKRSCVTKAYHYH